MAKRQPIQRLLEHMRVDFGPLSRDETATMQQQWRNAFSHRVKRATGEWVHAGYDWHAFSYEFVFCLTGEDAITEYRKQHSDEYLLLPHTNSEVAYRCSSPQLPTLPMFSRKNIDVYICPLDFGWTMVFTHEDGWLGPFFTTRDWAESREPQRRQETAK